MEGRLDMFLARSLTPVLLVIALSLSACAAIDFYPSPRPIDLAVGQGLIYKDWDGGYPLRFVAFILNPVGVVVDLFFNQTAYNLFALDSELFGYTNQDELYRRDFRRYRYSWPSFGTQWSGSSY